MKRISSILFLFFLLFSCRLFPVKKTPVLKTVEEINAFNSTHDIRWIDQAGYYEVINQAIFSPDDRYLFTQDYVSNILIWHIESGKLVRFFDNTEDIFSDSVYFTPGFDGIISLKNDKIEVFDFEGTLVHQFTGTGLKIMALSYTWGGKYIGILTEGLSVLLLNPDNLSIEKELKGLLEKATHLEISPDGNYLATQDSVGELQVWDINTLTLRSTIRDPDSTFGSVMIGKSNRIASTDKKKKAKLWDLDGNCISVMTNTSYEIDVFSLSPDGNYLVFSGDKNILYETATGTILKEYPVSGEDLHAVSSKGDLAVFDFYDGISIRKIEDGSEFAYLKNNRYVVKNAAFSKNGNYLFLSYSRLYMDSFTALLNTLTGEVEQVTTSMERRFFDAQLSPDLRYFSTAGQFGWAPSFFGEFIIWYRDKRNLTIIEQGADYLNFIDISHDGKYIITDPGNEGKNIKLWNSEGELLRVFEYEDKIYGLGFNSTSEYIGAQVYQDFFIWHFRGPLFKQVKDAYGASFSPAANEILLLKGMNDPPGYSSDPTFTTVEVIDFINNKTDLSLSFEEIEKTVKKAVFSDDGMKIILIRMDNSLSVLNIHDGSSFFELPGPGPDVMEYATLDEENRLLLIRYKSLSRVRIINTHTKNTIWYTAFQDGTWIFNNDLHQFDCNDYKDQHCGLMSGTLLPLPETLSRSLLTPGLYREFIKE